MKFKTLLPNLVNKLHECTDTPTFLDSTNYFRRSASKASKHFRISLIALLLFVTVQVNATNYFSVIPIIGQWLAEAALWLQPDEVEPVYCDYDPCAVQLATDCGFLITSVSIESVTPNPPPSMTTYKICVQANDQTSTQSWSVLNFSTPVASGSSPTMCFPPITILSSTLPAFTIHHTVNGKEGNATCSQGIIIASEEDCPEDILTATVENCDLETSIDIDLSNISTPYVIDFGDGGPAAASSASQVSHTYGGPGNYKPCLTYVIPHTESTITCCYQITVALPPGCVCPEDVISVISVEPCTWTASLNFDLDAGNFPLTVDYGDLSSPEVVTGSPATHSFPDPGNYKVCYSYETELGTLECCEQVTIPGCCLNPEFSIVENTDDPISCLNQLYKISDVACANSITTTHHWEFSDGTTYDGPNPPDHLFTNFLDEEGEVCVTHTVTCCEESASVEHCVSHYAGAFIGFPNEETFFTDIIPTTSQEVWEFIQMYADDPSLPLTIDGTLIVNKNAPTFEDGIWYMGKDAEIIVRFNNNVLPFVTRNLSLDGTTIQSAIRLEPPRGGCCRWVGIRSEGRTSISLHEAYLMDAKYAIRYPAPATVAAGNIASKIVSVNSHFINNWIGIQSNRQLVAFSSFSGNEMDGAPHEQICGCDAINAFDFIDVNPSLTTTIPAPGHLSQVNTVRNYEKAFRFRNSKLNVRLFDIEALQNYENIGELPSSDNNLATDESAIGIDFRWTKSNPSTLTLDDISFTDFVMSATTAGVAVRDRIFAGPHTLTAVAGHPLGSITTAGIAGGYQLFSGVGSANFNGTIRGNSIYTNGDKYGFGVNGNFLKSNNTLVIADNEMAIDANPASPSALNGGVVLSSTSSTNSLGQNFSVLGNTIDLYLAQGPGIGISNTRSFIVRRNKIKNNSDAIGIQLINGGSGLVGCNDVRNKPLGMDVNLSTGVKYEANLFKGNDDDVHFTGNVMGNSAFPTRIRRNIFRQYDGTSMVYIGGAVTGDQNHDFYNRWETSSTTTIALNTVTGNHYLRPTGATLGSPMSPTNPFGNLLFVNGTPAGADTVTTDGFCTSAHDGFEDFTPGPDPKDDWVAIVNDAGYWSGLTSAEKAYMQQEIYGLLLTNPSWTSSTALSSFKTGQDASFIGRSEVLRQDWQQLMDDITAYQATLAPTVAALESLSAQAQIWMDTIQVDTTLQDSLELLLDTTLQEADSLQALLETSDSLFNLTVEDSIGLLLADNALLDDDSLYAYYEKRYNEIVLKWLAGSEPDSADIADLRQMAMTCLRYGGRAVLSARALCEVWLNEYYEESGCDTTIQSRSSEGAALAKLETSAKLRILPSPAHDRVWISLQNPAFAEQKLHIFTADGRRVYEGVLPPDRELEIPVTGWQNGLYLAKVSSGGEVQTCNFVVQHP